MKYSIIRDKTLDFADQGYADLYPNLHKYPATMLPQIGVALLKRLGISSGILLDPYCGSGSSFAAALDVGITQMFGFDLNPLAILITQAKFTKIAPAALDEARQKLREAVFEFVKKEKNLNRLELPNITNIDYWFSPAVAQNLNVLRYFIDQMEDQKIKNFFLVPYAETIRECSYTRNNEFKLYRIKPAEILSFNPDVFSAFFKKLTDSIQIYADYYFPKIQEETHLELRQAPFSAEVNPQQTFDIVLTSPPYGDSRTTVAYGQFSTLANEWLGVNEARKLDNALMGGKRVKRLYNQGVLEQTISQIAQIDEKRALDVSAFYFDLQDSIAQIAPQINPGGNIIYLVGNRTVKGAQLPTDQFIAEQFEQYGFKHQITYERALSSKVMPSQNSPSNQKGAKVNTMLFEYVIICEKDKSAG
ncbi:MAG: modification methylase [Cyanobacteria bacterium RI_101]|nr:modification methylase [Cyanobacteria bacterium RI_101]